MFQKKRRNTVCAIVEIFNFKKMNFHTGNPSEKSCKDLHVKKSTTLKERFEEELHMKLKEFG